MNIRILKLKEKNIELSIAYKKKLIDRVEDHGAIDKMLSHVTHE